MAKACPKSSVTPRRSSFDSPNPTTEPGPEPACRAASRASVFASSGCRIRLAATITPTCAAPGRAEAFRASSSTISRAGVMPPDERRVRRRVDLDLQPPRPLGAVVERRLAHDPPHVGLAAHARARHVVEALEAEPPAGVSGVEARRPVGRQGRRQPDAVLRRQLAHRTDPHGAGEVQVEVGLGQVRDGPLGRSGRVAHSESESSSYGSSMTCTAASSADAPAPSIPTSSPTRSFSSS